MCAPGDPKSPTQQSEGTCQPCGDRASPTFGDVGQHPVLSQPCPPNPSHPHQLLEAEKVARALRGGWDGGPWLPPFPRAAFPALQGWKGGAEAAELRGLQQSWDCTFAFRTGHEQWHEAGMAEPHHPTAALLLCPAQMCWGLGTFPAPGRAREMSQGQGTGEDSFLLAQALITARAQRLLVSSELGRHFPGAVTSGKCCFPQSTDLKHLQLVSTAGSSGTLLLSALGSK